MNTPLKTVVLALGSLFCSQLSFAVCDLTAENILAENITPENINIDLGDITIDANAQVGQVLARREFQIQKQLNTTGCDPALMATMRVEGKLNQAQSNSIDPQIYQTNIQGIGLRLTQLWGGEASVYPFQNSTSVTQNIVGDRLVVEVIKMDEYTGTGTLRTGQYATFYLQHQGKSKPIFTANLIGHRSSFSNSSCKLEHESLYQHINLEPVRTGQLLAIGATANEKAFKVKLNCQKFSKGSQSVMLGFKYDEDGVAGVIRNNQVGNKSRGVGMQLLNASDQSVVLNGSKVLAGQSNVTKKSQHVVDLIARYYKTENTITPGLYYSTVTFHIDYQ